MIRKREIMKTVHRELEVEAQRKKTVRGIRSKILQECMETVAKKTNYMALIRADIDRKIEMMEALHKELVKSNLECRADDDDDDGDEMFVPRKLFLFKVDTFKNDMPNQTMSIPKPPPCMRSFEDKHAHGTEKEFPTKKRSMRTRVLKFFGVK
ncbi:uncharacterized protein LOC134257420 [Saccostrea cucullata]|uniref:uncharacterized protein LOC134257420 n=1 Tax=Saccostrea cuccullata TaxID=36930 RepID=UPI002ED534CE